MLLPSFLSERYKDFLRIEVRKRTKFVSAKWVTTYFSYYKKSVAKESTARRDANLE